MTDNSRPSLPVRSNAGAGPRTLPHSLESEEHLLSCCLLDGPDVVSRCLEAHIKPESFYDQKHGLVYERIVDLYNRQQPIDVSVLAEELKTARLLDQIGGYAFLAQISSRIPTTAQAGYFIEKVREQSLLRSLIRTADRAAERAYSYAGNLEEFLDETERDMFAVTQSRIGDRVQTAPPIVKEAMGVLNGMIARKGELTGLRSGFTDIDRLTWGFQKSDMIIVAARPSMGKAQPLTEPVLTPHGFVPMGEINPGDYVIGHDGMPKRVMAVFPQGRKKVYRVEISDGTFTRCCDEHLWLTQTRDEKRRGVGSSVKSLAAIRRTIKRSDGGNRNHKLPLVGPVNFQSQGATLPLDPWLLGALLGDGKLGDKCISFHKPEEDVKQKVIERLPPGDDVSRIADGFRIRRRVRNNTVSETRKALEQMGLCVNSQHKFIPAEYLSASPYQRLELLRGLLDTDGFTNPTCFEFCSTSERLMDGVCFLVRSLGGICRVPPSRVTRYSHKGELKNGLRSWRAHIWFLDETRPVSSAKHCAKMVMGTRHVGRSIADVQEDGEEECQCISVEGSLYVTRDFIVTHNTAIALNFAENFVLPAIGKPTPVLFFSLEMSASQLMQRLICSRARVNMKLLREGLTSRNGDELGRLANASKALSEAPLLIDDSSSISVSHIRARARRAHSRRPLGAIVVDYLQIMMPGKHDVPREQQVADACRGLKSLAKELNIPVFVLSQLNRASEKENRSPKLADLRESGSIEQDADVVLMLSRPREDEENGGDGFSTAGDTVDITIAKHRNGPVGSLKLTFLRDICRFENFVR